MCWWAAISPCAESSFGTETESSCVMVAALQQLAVLFQVNQCLFCYVVWACSNLIRSRVQEIVWGWSLLFIIISVVEGYKCTTALKKKKKNKRNCFKSVWSLCHFWWFLHPNTLQCINLHLTPPTDSTVWNTVQSVPLLCFIILVWIPSAAYKWCISGYCSYLLSFLHWHVKCLVTMH